MFKNTDLVEYFKKSFNISLYSLVTAEWNMNIPGVIDKVGNYRYRPTDTDSKYQTIPNTYDPFDFGDFYSDATLSYKTVADKVSNLEEIQIFSSTENKIIEHYSLEDCTKPFRPRSGINKIMFFNNKYIPGHGLFGNNSPRYYLSSKYDQFKYWTSYRTENNKERGIANKIVNGNYLIEDACPFIIYNSKIPCNRIVIKIQTNTGYNNAGTIQTNTGTIEDPFFGENNKTVPNKFKIQILKNNSWIDIFNVNTNQTKPDGTAIIGADGYLELAYYNNQWFQGSSEVNYDTPFVTEFVNPISVIDETNNEAYYKEFDQLEGIRVVVDSMKKFDSVLDLIEISPRLVADISSRVMDFSITKNLSDMSASALPVGQLLASTGNLNIFNDDYAFTENNSGSIISKYIDKNIKFNFYENIDDGNNINYIIPIKTLYSDGLPQFSNNGASITMQLRDFYFYLESQSAPRMLLTDVSLSYAVATMLDSIGFSNYSFKRLSGETDPIIPYFFVAPNQNVAEVLNQLAVSTQSAMFFDEYNNLIIMSKGYMLPENNQRETDFTLIGDATVDPTNNTTIAENLPNIIAISASNKKVYNDGRINYTTRYIQRQYASIAQSTMVDQDKTWTYKPSLLWEVSGDDATKTINQQVSKQGKYVLGAMPLNSDLSNLPPTVVNNILINNTIDLGENIYYLTRYKGYLYSSGEIIKYDAAEFSVTLEVWYDIKQNNEIDYSKPYVVQPGSLAPIEYKNSVNIQVNSGILTEQQGNELINQWKLTRRQGSSNLWISSNQEYQKYFSMLPFNGKMYPTGLLRIYAEPYYETIDGITKMKNGNVVEHGRAQFNTQITNHYTGINTYWSNNDYVRGCNMQSNYLFTTEVDPTLPNTETGIAGVNNVLAKQTSRTGIIRNFLSSNYLSETQINELKSTKTGTIQSSALVMSGPTFKTEEKPLDFISYTFKELNNSYKHFGTRLRVVGKTENNANKIQTPFGSSGYYQIAGNTPDQNVNIGGGSGGIGVLLNPENNNGYYFEIIALTEKNIDSYIKKDNSGKTTTIVNNVIFYKIKKETGSSNAIPVKLWGGLANILVDDGKFTGQYRFASEENPTVYDLSVEYLNIGKTRRFFLYLNNKLIATVDDTDPLPMYNNVALFVRGSSKCMFENIYALNENYSQNTIFNVAEPLSITFGDQEINANEALTKYSMSGIIQSTYLSGISSQQSPKYNIYFDEFGSIMRECAYFDIKYDKAYPALYAQLSPTFNKIKGYTTSGFYADSYGAEFLIFNATDSALNLDETTGNYLRIQGITFTQDTTYQLTVDEYFNKKSNNQNIALTNSNMLKSPLISVEAYNEIKQSRLNYGVKDFTFEAPYIQRSDDAEEMLGWLIKKSMKPKKTIGVNIFSTPILQLGDIVNIKYSEDNIDLIAPEETQFIIYNITYSRSQSGPEMIVYLVEV